jgi:hypothetical protein
MLGLIQNKKNPIENGPNVGEIGPERVSQVGGGGAGQISDEKKFFSRGGRETFWGRRAKKGDPENEKTRSGKPSVGEIRGEKGTRAF